MPATLEAEKSEIAALSAKLSGARDEIKLKDKELNDLRNRVVLLEDKSITEKLEVENDTLAVELLAAEASIEYLGKQIAKAERDLKAARPALDLAAAIKGI